MAKSCRAALTLDNGRCLVVTGGTIVNAWSSQHADVVTDGRVSLPWYSPVRPAAK